jgi:hypothetical protein
MAAKSSSCKGSCWIPSMLDERLSQKSNRLRGRLCILERREAKPESHKTLKYSWDG